jgi:hypothetical protein
MIPGLMVLTLAPRLPHRTASAITRSRRLLALGSQGCDGSGRYDNLLVRYDLDTRRVVSTLPLDLPVEPFGLDVDRSGRHVLIAVAGKPNDQHPATVYVIRDGHPQSVPFPGDCWQAEW